MAGTDFRLPGFEKPLESPESFVVSVLRNFEEASQALGAVGDLGSGPRLVHRVDVQVVLGVVAEVVAGVEDTGGTPDPLLRAWRAAVRTILEELPRELSSQGIQTAEVTLDVPRAKDPEESAKPILRALKDPESPDDEPCIHSF